ncbi:hypothetical protein BLOT_012436 [Blomia tropicalis]|nr:hypothetical protein BLOT_012436 [Blomia tropicalis]
MMTMMMDTSPNGDLYLQSIERTCFDEKLMKRNGKDFYSCLTLYIAGYCSHSHCMSRNKSSPQ